MWKVDSNFNQIVDIAYSFQKSKVFFTAIELELFTAIGNSSLTAAELSDLLNTDAHSTDRLLNALCCMGLINKDGGNYKNSEASKRHLVVGSSEYIGSLMHINDLWDSWSNMTECIVQGKPKNFKTINEKDEEWIENYLISMQWKNSHEAPEVISMLNLRDSKKVLDLGCGCASYSLEIAKSFPQIECFAFDYPNVIKQTKKLLQKSIIPNNVKAIEGDFKTDKLGSGYDCVLISNVLNEYSIWENIKLLQKVYDCLDKDGSVVIHQQIISDDRIYPNSAVMEALNMIVNTPDGDCFTETDIWVMLKESWFQEIEKYNTEFGTSIIVARKATTF